MSEDLSIANDAWLDIVGRVCVITGAASGIGAETARQFAAVGAHVALLDRDGDGVMETAAQINSGGGRAVGIEADVTRIDQLTAAAECVNREFGGCRILVNNAAVLSSDGLMTLDLEKWNEQMSVNLTGALLCTRAFVGQMIDQGEGGSIINVASITGQQPMPFGGAYSVSKAALIMLTRVLTMELASHQIRSNTVAPALVHTPMSDAAYKDPEIARERKKMVPAGRIGSPRDLANAILFLASDRSSYINGQEVLVDGGLTQTLMSMIPRPSSN